MAVLGDTADLPPADIAVVAPGVWSPSPPATSYDIVNPYPLSGLRARVGDRRSVAVLGSGLTAVDIACALDDGETRVHLLSRTGTLPRVQVEATQTAYAPEHLTEDAVIGLAVRNELTAAVGARAARTRTRPVRILRFQMFSMMPPTPITGQIRWPIRPTSPAITHSAPPITRSTAPSHCSPSRNGLRFVRPSGSKWFRYRVRIPLSRWRQLRAMQDAGRLILHAGVDANAKGLDRILTDLGVDRVIPAYGQSSTLVEGPELVADLVASGLVDCDDAGQGLVDPATCRALIPDGGPRDDLLLVGQVSAGSYFTVSALDVVVRQASHAAQTIADSITSRTRLRVPAASKAA